MTTVGGARTYFLPKNLYKNTMFLKGSLKTYYFWPARVGARAPLDPPPDAHEFVYLYLLYKILKYSEQ